MNLAPLIPFIKQASQSSNSKIASIANTISPQIGYHEGMPESGLVSADKQPDPEGAVFDHTFKDLAVDKEKINSTFGKAEKKDPKISLKQQLQEKYRV